MLNRYDVGGTVTSKSLYNLRLDPEMRADLQAMADEQDRSLHNMIINLLRRSIEEWKQQRSQSDPSVSP